MYLCKNGAGVWMELLEQSDEHTFILRNVSVWDSGNYSCVYSLNKYPLNKVSTSGHKTIQVKVTELFQRQGQSGQDNNTDRKTKSKKPAGEPVYGKVQKKKEKAYDDSFIHASNDDGDDLVHKPMILLIFGQQTFLEAALQKLER
ncbi:hypothetical protein NFI96_031521 [Prochilodus magdalenae]|nr:hypothetical protein NFI96_031521 [Prochilodus magdalenae]